MEFPSSTICAGRARKRTKTAPAARIAVPWREAGHTPKPPSDQARTMVTRPDRHVKECRSHYAMALARPGVNALIRALALFGDECALARHGDHEPFVLQDPDGLLHGLIRDAVLLHHVGDARKRPAWGDLPGRD